MCGILVHKGQGDNTKIKFRGQDHTSEKKVNGLTFVHNLLSITGEFTIQPFMDEEKEIVCLYNGEIYNHSFKNSDGEVIIPLYKKYGKDFVKHLDGEFAIALYDFKNRKVFFVTDPFGTKPMFINGIECASYRSGIGGQKMLPNTLRIVDMDTEKFTEELIHEWDFIHQDKTNYDDWIIAFQRSIKKRAKNGCFIGLSSGYDSGAIACELLKQDINFKAYSFIGKENKDILTKRLSLIKDFEYFSPLGNIQELLKQRIDNEKYTIYYGGKEVDMHALDDGGIYGIGSICLLANLEGRKVTLSGQGADEILSDYSLFPGQSEFKGVFPKNLSKWRNFNNGCQESYLIKEEYAGGAFNIETRYPFLDKEVVQEFLWLSTEAKNVFYKAPLREYLLRNNFPFEEGKKIGFSVDMTKKNEESIILPKPIILSPKKMKILLITGDTIAPWAISFRANELKKRWINDHVDVVSKFEGNPNEYDVVHILFSALHGQYCKMIEENPDKIFTSIVGKNTLEYVFDSEEVLRNYFINSKKIVCLNKDIQIMANTLIGPEHSQKTIFIPNGVDEKLFNRKFVVGFVGSSLNTEYKGYYLIKEACDKLDIELLTTELQFPDMIPREKMPEFYQKIDCLCIASMGEGTNNPTMEALSMNKPVVSTRTGIAAELPGVILVDRTVESIMEGINKVNFRSHILQNYTWDIIAKKYHDLYLNHGDI